MAHFITLLAGVLFSLGLIVSGMINPAKVLGFLDISGQWDGSLAFVMAAAVLVTMVGYRLVLRRAQPLFAAEFSIPKRSDIDRRLISGAALFGVGWGLVGLCPGPAIAALGAAPAATIAFFVAMVAGMAVARVFADRADASQVVLSR